MNDVGDIHMLDVDHECEDDHNIAKFRRGAPGKRTLLHSLDTPKSLHSIRNQNLLQQLRLHNPRLLINKPIRLNPPMPLKRKRPLLALPTQLQINLRNHQLIPLRPRLRDHVPLGIHNRAAGDEVVSPVV